MVKQEILYDENKQIGTDYSIKEKAEVYDSEMSSFRNYDDEVNELIQKMGIINPNELSVLDIGCGTGAFTISAAKQFNKIIAADISMAMLSILKHKSSDIRNIEILNKGFLNLPENLNVDIVNTKWALHHLPDFWKQYALIKINRNLVDKGKLFLSDLVFSDNMTFPDAINELLPEQSDHMDKTLMEEVKIHIKEEFSTFNWILEGMLERAGFEIDSIYKISPYETQYICIKIKKI